MNNSKLINIFLILAGLIGLYVGVGLVFFPVELQAQNNIIIGGNASHLSETRAPGMAILATSIIVLTGAFKASWKDIALKLTALFFTSYGLGRLLSLSLDGMPADGLFYAMFGELVIGIIAITILLKMKKA